MENGNPFNKNVNDNKNSMFPSKNNIPKEQKSIFQKDSFKIGKFDKNRFESKIKDNKVKNKTEKKMENKQEVKLENKPETKLDSKPENKPETKLDNKPPVNKPENKLDNKPPVNKPENKLDNKLDNKQENKDLKNIQIVVPTDNENNIKVNVSNGDKIYTLPSGAVGRRAPLNPFSSPMLGKYRRKKKGAVAKVKDPRLNNNPLIGRLLVCISTTAILFWVFFAEMILNYNTFNGRCISKVLYPSYKLQTPYERKPYIIAIGYGACEYNLDEKAENRHFVGKKTTDHGWPSDKVEDVDESGIGEVNWDSVNSRIYSLLGGLDTNLIRNYGELYRLFWAMYLHGGFMHILFNVSCQIQILWMIEPDWGTLRTLLLFFISGVTGNLLSTVCDPCGVTVGSSGALYGLIGALFTYCIEYWKTIPRPCCVLIFMIVVIIFGIFIGMFGYTDNYAHMGGCLAGILYGFATITTISAADKCTLGERMLMSPPFSWFLSKETKQLIEAKAKEKKKKGEKYRKKQLEQKVHKDDKIHVLMSVMKNRINEEGRPPCRMNIREWIVRITAACCLIFMWIILFIYLLDESAYKSYKPLGQIKFSGKNKCYCCTINKTDTNADLTKLYWCFSTEEDANKLCHSKS